MIQADERCCLRHAVSLNHAVAHALEKTLRVARQRRAARNERPKLPPKAPMNAATHPRASKELSPIGSLERARQPRRFSPRVVFTLQSAFQEVQHARHGDKG